MDTDKFVDVMHFKNIIISNKYKDEINIDKFDEWFSNSFGKFYHDFIETYIYEDIDFFHIDKDILNVISKIVDCFSENKGTISGYHEDIAYNIIMLINEIYYDTSDYDRKIKRDEYLARERAMRGLFFLKDDEVFKTIQADYEVYDYFINPKTKDTPYYGDILGHNLSKEIVYHAKYFSQIFPELYEDPMVLEKTLCAAEDVQNQEYERRKTRKVAKTITKKMNYSEK